MMYALFSEEVSLFVLQLLRIFKRVLHVAITMRIGYALNCLCRRFSESDRSYISPDKHELELFAGFILLFLFGFSFGFLPFALFFAFQVLLFTLLFALCDISLKQPHKKACKSCRNTASNNYIPRYHSTTSSDLTATHDDMSLSRASLTPLLV